MNYAAIRKFDVANGPGIRSTIFVSGCTHNCKGCFNKEYQDFNYGKPWTKEVEDQVIENLKDPNVSGLTILGGEPLQQVNDEQLASFLKRVKVEVNKNVWIFTGYVFEKIQTDEKILDILKWCDVLVDGPFIEAKKNLNLRFRGSSNQRIIDLQETFKNGSVILLEKY